MVKRNHDFHSDDTVVSSSSDAGSSSTAPMSSISSSASSSTDPSSSPSNSEPGSPTFERPTMVATRPSTFFHVEPAGAGRPRGNIAGLLLLGMADPNAPTPRMGTARSGPARVLFPRPPVEAEAARVALAEEVRRIQARALDFEVTAVSTNGTDFKNVEPVSYDQILRPGNLPKRLRLSDLLGASSTTEEQGPAPSTTATPPGQQGPTPR